MSAAGQADEAGTNTSGAGGRCATTAPLGGSELPAAAYFYSPDRSGAHAETWLRDFHDIVQADAFSGFGRLYEPGRKPGPIHEAACWAHARRKFFELAELRKAPIAIEAVMRIDAIFAIERAANGLAPDERCAHHRACSAALVADLEVWLRENRAKLSAKTPTAAAIDYLLKRWTAFAGSSTTDGSACPTMPPNAPSVPSRWDAATGPSPARMRAAIALRPCTP